MTINYCDRCGSACLDPKLFLTAYLCKNCHAEAWARFQKFLEEGANNE